MAIPSPKELDSLTSFDQILDLVINKFTASDASTRALVDGSALEHSRQWMNAIGNPQRKLKPIHIAGTAGKGSTSYMIAAILTAHGFKTGLHVSPHIHDIRERIQINNKMISKADFIRLVRKHLPSVFKLSSTDFQRPTYYEFNIGLMFDYMAEQAVDYAVVETGLGGRYDSTNTLDQADKLSVITRLGLDHTEILGDTLEQIAWQKAGIIKPNSTALALKQNDTGANQVIKNYAAEQNAKLVFVDVNKTISANKTNQSGINFSWREFKNVQTSLFGDFQLDNLAIALEAIRTLAKRDGWQLKSQLINQALQDIVIPARFERTKLLGVPVIVDSAHSPQKIAAFLDALKTLKLDPKPIAIFGSKHGKNMQASLKQIGQQVERVYATSFFLDKPPQMANFAVRADAVAAEFKTAGVSVAGEFSSPLQALKAAKKSLKPNQLIVIFGSMYMLGELYEELNKVKIKL